MYHLSAPYSWCPLPERIAALAEAIKSHDRTCPDRGHIASIVGWALETQLALVELDLAAPTTAVWPVRAASLQRCYLNSPPDESPAQFAGRLASTEAAIAATAGAKLKCFVGGLDQGILRLSSLLGCMPWHGTTGLQTGGKPFVPTACRRRRTSLRFDALRERALEMLGRTPTCRKSLGE